ncbi:NUDIX domain-containing protein [Ruminococcus sp. XPD3002]|uniref:NUDIX domain-containing protein n=1 Tax=Ruminococcus sp. XPD3002 TaxID=1452269 RepID=UPI000917A4B6|nr:NUDIX domain-containing protein [Ruminococcus sp.]SFX68564.1 8-oxo-dGTP diphosphatase [Ruminococcus flavefaciens]HPY83454.1 NUDIX domain-containing protein [Ruminococcus flavefaciens]HRU96095.1 NUDIX domain-containing protein [Ruminococcus sp.]
MTATLIVKGIVFSPDMKKILLLQRSSFEDTGAYCWEPPGGKIEENESPEEAVLREIQEESGISIDNVDELLDVSLFKHNGHTLLSIGYLCHSDTYSVTLSEEHMDYLWADEEQCRKMMLKEIVEELDRKNVFSMLIKE